MMTKEQEKRLQKLEDEIKALREEMAGAAVGQWLPKYGDRYLWVAYDGNVDAGSWTNTKYEQNVFDRGRVFPDTTEGREAAEWFAFCEGFRARWKRSADREPSEYGYIPFLDGGGVLCFSHINVTSFSLPKWSSEEACRAFVDSEGGSEKFAEILKRGIL